MSTPSPIVSSATVTAAPLTAQGVPISGYEGLPVGDFPVPGTPPSDVLVATFVDNGVAGSPSAYTASINWGDGSRSRRPPGSLRREAATARCSAFTALTRMPALAPIP